MPPEDRSPFEEDTAVRRVAADAGFEVVRRYCAVEIYDTEAVAVAGYTTARTVPDYERISRALERGLTVSGARLVGTRYVLGCRKGGRR